MKPCAINAVVTTILLLIASCNTNEVGNCALDDISDDLDSIGIQCASAVTVLLNLDNLPIPDDEVVAALDVLCTAECGLAVASYFVIVCQEYGIPVLLQSYCLPKGMRSRGNYCRQSFPDSVNITVISNLRVCENASSSSCPVGCDMALIDLSYEVGCCYQALYNSSISYFFSDIFFAEDVLPIQYIYNPTLWADCGVPLLEFCPDVPFPSDGSQTCDFDGFVRRELPSRCEESYNLVRDPLVTFTDEGKEAYEVICEEDCFLPLINYYDRNCYDPIGSIIMSLDCLVTDGNLGRRCRFSLDDQIEDTGIFQAIDRDCEFFSDSPACSDECKDSIMELSTVFGCCYQSIYNNSEVITLLLLAGEIYPDEAFLFTSVGNQIIWDNCQVPLIEECLSSGAVKSTDLKGIVIFTVSIFAILYHT